MQIKWLRRAPLNLDEEAAYLAKDSPRMTSEFVQHLRDSVAMLVQHPNMSRPGRIAGTRELVVTRFSYLVPYRVHDSSVEILRILHTARKWPNRMQQ